MKMITAVFFFGIVTCAFAPNSPGIDKCEEPKAASNLDTSKFFSGTWYVTHAKKISTSVCHQFGITMKNGMITVNADGYYEIGRKRDFYKVPCTSTGKITSGKFSINCQPKRSDSQSKNTINVQVDVTVMETDNTKYALLYRCATSGPHKDDNYLVIQRNKDGELPQLKKSTVLPEKWITRQKSTNVCR